MATIKDVAKAAGLSLGTVSNVLNGRGSVKPQNQKKVQDAIRELDFHYNKMASSLRTKVTGNVGLIIPGITNPYYPEVARGVEDAACQKGLTVFLCNDDRNAAKEAGYIQALLSKGVDGIILLKPQVSLQELLVTNTRTVLVLGDSQADGTEISSQFHRVNADDVQGAALALRYLGQNGHRRIAMITGMMEAFSSRRRLEAYKSYLASAHIPYRGEYVICGDYSWESGCQAARRLMGLLEPPTAIFAANDMMAIGALKGVQMMGYQVPQDVSVIGYDDIELGNLSNPALTTICQPKYQMGAECLKVLYDSLRPGADSAEKKQIIMKNQLVVRDSVTRIR